jgi:D-beta-D-heptose 7-phosphate kinase/D-beta-D-heptose 1-phosphate adenosyltransferase
MTRRNLETLLQRCEGKKIAVIGDLVLDRYVWGNVERISPEAPVPVVEELRREDRLGGAANVVSNLLGLQCQVDIYGVVGVDLDGSKLLEMLRDRGVGCEGVVREEARPTTTKLRILGGTQQMLRLDRESRTPLGESYRARIGSSFRAHAAEYVAVVVSDYGKGVISRSVLDACTAVLDPSVPVVIDPHPANYDNYNRVFMIKPNKKEAEAGAGMQITDIESAFKAAQILLDRWQSEYSVITLGGMGVVMLNQDGSVRRHLAAQTRQVFDVSGAGDCVTSIFAAGLAAGQGVADIGGVANLAAGIVISEVGTAPITRKKLLQNIHS